MEEFESCSDISDSKPFYPEINLYLKPLLKINISIQIPRLKLVDGSISNITLMDNIRSWAAPDKFCSIIVTKSTLEFIRFEADLLNPSKAQAILARLNGKQVNLPGFKEMVKVRASIAKSDFPTRHDWDAYFRDAKHMNEMKAGERPDTLHLIDLPNKWFSTKAKEDLPSENVLKKVFQQFGEVAAVDIPSIDPYRSKMKAHLSGLKLFSFNQNSVFEAYVQFKDYISFVKAMDYLRGMKLLRIENGKYLTANIKVDFDKTKHLSEYSIRKRKIEREKIMEKDRELEEKKQKLEDALKELEEKEKMEAKAAEKKDKMDKKKKKNLKRKVNDGDFNLDKESMKIMKEEKLLLVAQRKLESIRLLAELLKIIEEKKKKLLENVAPNKSNEIVKRSEKNNINEWSNVTSSDEHLATKDTPLKTSCSDNGSRLNSEVVKVVHSSTLSDYRSRRNYSQRIFFNNGSGYYPNFRKWRRQRWFHKNGSKRIVNPNRPYTYHDKEYVQNAQQLYYKYFQSLTRNVGAQSSSSKRSQSPYSCCSTPNSVYSNRLKSRSKSRTWSNSSRSYRSSFSRSRSRSPESNRTRKRSATSSNRITSRTKRKST